ncbi:hypothetical protein QEO94_07330 [Kingella negevensis]|uniref:DnaT-like ssDNA-binding protein n=1 Tax=Kingella negevensis TaxID=1522312 RepID=UPI002542AA56|nr:DnaT-like ssDNA-binding protein [Kingella negevensis]WII92456.1 hypothetical protein QEO94_07330 [Kingella negevensis]
MLSYATLDYANEYHDARQTATRWDDFTPEQKQQRLVSASDLIDRIFRYAGKPESNTQIRAFPRILHEKQPALLPEAIKQACCELALLDDISGSLPNAAKVKNVGGVMLSSGECASDDKQWSLAMVGAVRLLQPFVASERMVRLERG